MVANDESQFSSDYDELPLTEDYRPLSKMAVGSLVLSLFSFLAWLSPVVWFLPIIGIGLGVSALITIQKGNRCAGERIAAMGLILSLFLLSASASHHLIQETKLTRIAREHADRWLQLVQDGELMHAHQLTLMYVERRPENVPVDVHYSSNEEVPLAMAAISVEGSLRNQLNSFFSGGPQKDLAEYGRDAKIEFVNLARTERNSFSVQSLHLLYSMTPPGEQRSTLLMVMVERVVDDESGNGHWRIVDVQYPTVR